MEQTNFESNAFDRVTAQDAAAITGYQRSLWFDIKKSMASKHMSFVCLVVLIIITLASLLAPLSPYDPNQMEPGESLQSPSAQHWLGTDFFGRDYLTRALYGGRVSLCVGFFSMLGSTLIGVIIGTVSGYAGGKTDVLLMRFIEIFNSVPDFLLMVVINAFLKPNMATLVIVISAFSWTGMARITRAEAMSLKSRDFVLAARASGTGHCKIIIRHIIPNMSSSIIVSAGLSVASAILRESSLSYLGLGIQEPNASWGSMLQDAQTFILYKPSLAVYPELLILLTVISFNILSDVLRNAPEPRMIK